MEYKSSRKRSFVKSLTWRCISVIMDLIVVYWFLTKIAPSYGIIMTTFAVVLTTNAISIVLYYIHERIWNKSMWGKVKK